LSIQDNIIAYLNSLKEDLTEEHQKLGNLKRKLKQQRDEAAAKYQAANDRQAEIIEEGAQIDDIIDSLQGSGT